MRVPHAVWVLVSLPFLAGATGESVILRDLSGLYPGTNQPAEHDIVTITDVLDGVLVVAFNPQVREVPNVLVYQVTDASMQRATEGLSIGIEVKQTQRIDLHTLGVAVDVALENPAAASKMLDSAHKAGMQGVNYGRFLHLHREGETRFILDKTMFAQLRTLLLDPDGSFSHGEAAETCILYDLPSLRSVKLSKNGARYVIEATTSNFQHWRVSFTGIDKHGRLVDKKVSATPLPPVSE